MKFKNLFLNVMFSMAGATLGYLYYIKIGCVSGTCPITSNPWISSLYGALVGFLLSGVFRKKKEQNKKTHDPEEKTAYRAAADDLPSHRKEPLDG